MRLCPFCGESFEYGAKVGSASHVFRAGNMIGAPRMTPGSVARALEENREPATRYGKKKRKSLTSQLYSYFLESIKERAHFWEFVPAM